MNIIHRIIEITFLFTKKPYPVQTSPTVNESREEIKNKIKTELLAECIYYLSNILFLYFFSYFIPNTDVAYLKERLKSPFV